MLACTFAHRKFLGRTPPGKAVLRAFLGGMKNEALLAESDEALVATVRREMSEILGAKTIGAEVEPEHAQVSRWRRAMAQYAVGHKERMQRIGRAWRRCRGCGWWGMRTTGSGFRIASAGAEGGAGAGGGRKGLSSWPMLRAGPILLGSRPRRG